MSANRWEGGLDPEEAERLASKFTPSWESATEPPLADGSEPAVDAQAPPPSPAQGSSDAADLKKTLIGVAPSDSVRPHSGPDVTSAPAPASPAASAGTPPPRSTVVVEEELPSIIINAPPPPVVKSRPPRAVAEPATVPIAPVGGFGKGLYLGLGLGAAAVIAVVLLMRPGNENAGSHETATTMPAVSQPTAPAAEESLADDIPTPAPGAKESPAASAAVVPASAPKPTEPLTTPAHEPIAPEAPKLAPTAAPPPKTAAPSKSAAPSKPPAPSKTAAPKAPKASSKPAKPAPAAKPRNRPSAGAIVRDAPF